MTEDRNAEIFRRLVRGETADQVAEDFELTSRRVHRIARRLCIAHGIEPPTLGGARAAARTAEAAATAVSALAILRPQLMRAR